MRWSTAKIYLVLCCYYEQILIRGRMWSRKAKQTFAGTSISLSKAFSTCYLMVLEHLWWVGPPNHTIYNSIPTSTLSGRWTEAMPWTWFYVAFPPLESCAKWTFFLYTLVFSLGVTNIIDNDKALCLGVTLIKRPEAGGSRDWNQGIWGPVFLHTESLVLAFF